MIRLAALLFIVVSTSGCMMGEWLGPVMERLGDNLQRQGAANTARLVEEIKEGREINLKDIIAPFALLLGGGAMGAGGHLIGKNGRSGVKKDGML